MSRFEGVEYLNISEGFDTYLKIKENGTIVQNMLDVFKKITVYMLNSSKIDSNRDLLKRFSLCKTNSSEDNEKETHFKKFFDVYSQYLYNQNPEQCKIIVSNITNIVSKLTVDTKKNVLYFIWSMTGFRKSLSLLPSTNIINNVETPYKGVDYLSKSVLSPLFNNREKYVPLKLALETFNSLVVRTTKEQFISIMGYFTKIIRANVQYTFEHIEGVKNTLAPYDFIGCVLVLIIKLIENNREYVFAEKQEQEIIYDAKINRSLLGEVWDVINIAFFTLYEIKRSTTMSCEFNKNKIGAMIDNYNKTRNPLLKESIRQTNNTLSEGKIILERMDDIIKNIDIESVNKIIFSNSYYIIESRDTAKLSRLRKYMLELTREEAKALSKEICMFVNSILKSNITPNMKSEFLRYIMAYSLCSDYGVYEVNQTDYIETLTDYILVDSVKLGDLKIIHSLDILETFGDRIYTSNKNYRKIIRLYLGYLEGINDLYRRIINMFLVVDDKIKANIINDMMSVIGSVEHYINIIGMIGQEALEYLDQLFSLIENIIKTKEHLKIHHNMTPAEIEQFNKSEDMVVLDSARQKCIEKFKPLIIQMLGDLRDISIYNDEEIELELDSNSNSNSDSNENENDVLADLFTSYYIKSDLSFSNSVLRMVLNDNIIRILKDIFDIDCKDLGIYYINVDKADVKPEMFDAVTSELLISPVAIPTSSNKGSGLVFVNQKTLHKILLGSVNPYTRQPLSYGDIFDINDRIDTQKQYYSILLNILRIK